jgi:hypothetical protein
MDERIGHRLQQSEIDRVIILLHNPNNTAHRSGNPSMKRWESSGLRENTRCATHVIRGNPAEMLSLSNRLIGSDRSLCNLQRIMVVPDKLLSGKPEVLHFS